MATALHGAGVWGTTTSVPKTISKSPVLPHLQLTEHSSNNEHARPGEKEHGERTGGAFRREREALRRAEMIAIQTRSAATACAAAVRPTRAELAAARQTPQGEGEEESPALLQPKRLYPPESAAVKRQTVAEPLRAACPCNCELASLGDRMKVRSSRAGQSRADRAGTCSRTAAVQHAE